MVIIPEYIFVTMLATVFLYTEEKMRRQEFVKYVHPKCEHCGCLSGKYARVFYTNHSSISLVSTNKLSAKKIDASMKTNFKATKNSLLRLLKQNGQHALNRNMAVSAPLYWVPSQEENGRFDAADMLPMLQHMVSVLPGTTISAIFVCAFECTLEVIFWEVAVRFHQPSFVSVSNRHC